MKNIYITALSIAVASLLCAGCAADDPVSRPANDSLDHFANEPYFPKAKLITRASPLSVIKFDRPTFTWDRTYESVVVVAVFDTTIDLHWDRRRILNVDRIVWLWHSQLGAESEGEVSIDKMIPMLDGRIDTLPRPRRLERRTYYWLIWAFDPDARTIKWSSPRMRLVVDR